MGKLVDDFRCPKHPKYKANKRPKYECETCLNMYFKLRNSPRMLPKPTRVFKDKSKYTRKQKHKNKEN